MYSHLYSVLKDQRLLKLQLVLQCRQVVEVNKSKTCPIYFMSVNLSIIVAWFLKHMCLIYLMLNSPIMRMIIQRMP